MQEAEGQGSIHGTGGGGGLRGKVGDGLSRPQSPLASPSRSFEILTQGNSQEASPNPPEEAPPASLFTLGRQVGGHEATGLRPGHLGTYRQ